MLAEQIKQLSRQVAPRVVEIRRDIHANPELSLKEQRTAALVADELRTLGLEVNTGWVGTGVAGILKGVHPGKTVMLRADMDALPIQEETGLPYASKNEGVMHACGHDGHTAVLLGAAHVLCALKEQIHGTIKFYFQPSEEANNGAGDSVKQGILENPRVDYALGLHLWGPLEKGKVAVRKGPIMACNVEFKFRLIGKGGHGSMPHTAIDPIAMTVCAISNINHALDRSLSPFDSSVVSFCSIHGGNCYNVIPEYVDVVGTARAFDQTVIGKISSVMEKTLASVAESWGGRYEFTFDSSIPPLVNDDEITGIVKHSVEKMIGSDMVYDLPNPEMGSEDFSHYACAVPSSFFFVGIAEDLKNPPIHHNKGFAWNDDVLETAVSVMSMAAFDILDSKAGS